MTDDRIRALTVRQPWASLIALGHKRIETRSWKTDYRGPLVIHAGASLAGWGRRGSRTRVGEFEIERVPGTLLLRGPIAWPYALPLGAAVAKCTLIDVVPIHAQPCNCRYACDEHPYPHPACNPNGHPPSGPYVWAAEGYPAFIQAGTVGDPPHPWTGGTRGQVGKDLPYGDYRCGRHAWLLDNVQPIRKPIPAKGQLGLWKWERQS